MRLAMQFMIAGIQIIYKLQMYIMSQFISYKDNGMKMYQKVHKHLLTKLLQKS